MQKRLLEFRPAPAQHWVGNGFPVRTLLSHQNEGQQASPFLLLDYGGPAEFQPGNEQRGVGEHPHRGFETVTIVYQGRLEHRDSAGNTGRIGPGDVQWMTAASGVVHEEWHEQAFVEQGGMFEMVQLWVNLPARFKMLKPGYQEILAAQIPTVAFGGFGSARVIAGSLADVMGPAKTFSPVTVADLQLSGTGTLKLDLPDSHNLAVAVLQGSVTVDGGKPLTGPGLALFDPAGTSVELAATAPAKVLLLAGKPLNEPIVGRGPFVMNTADEIRQAIADYQSGRMGTLSG